MEQTLFWIATFIVAGIVLIVLGPWLYKRHTDRQRGLRELDDTKLEVYISGDAVRSQLVSEFSRLVSEISYYHAAVSGKLMTQKEQAANHYKKDANKKIILAEDEEVAFRQAIKELNCEGSRCTACDKPSTLLEKVRRLRKEYEKKYEFAKKQEQERRKKKPL